MKRVIFLFLLFIIACAPVDDVNVVENNTVVNDNVADKPVECFLFDYPPVNLEKISYIIPMGSVTGEHVAPIDHQYYVDAYDSEKEIEVYAPADGTVFEMQHMGSFQGDYGGGYDDYRFVIRHDCGLESHFIHVDKLSDKLKNAAPPFGEYNSVDVEVAAGEVLGAYTGSVDYNVVDYNIEITLINYDSYSVHDKRLYIADPFDYFNEDIREELIEKSLRDEKPYGGSIDDVPDTIIGTWFKKDTNGWSGLKLERYWADHLAIVYHHLDTDHIIISIGTFKGKAKQFGVKGNSPDLSDIEPGDMVEYELVDYQVYLNNQPWDFETYSKELSVINHEYVAGVFLMEMIDDETIKVEILPDKTADEVAGFNNPDYYVR